MEHNAEFTAAAYHITKDNMLVSNPTPGAGLLSVGKQTAKGIELALGL
ncbi:TonB-dependent receptor, partial [Paenibacillus polymyxa]|nr:TonB-dependent receptor [Paenibacillus polymyxa]